jgi:hypothetical protein
VTPPRDRRDRVQEQLTALENSLGLLTDGFVRICVQMCGSHWLENPKFGENVYYGACGLGTMPKDDCVAGRLGRTL